MPYVRKVTDAQLMDAVKAGLIAKQIALAYGVSHQAISQRLSKLGIKAAPRPKRVKMSAKYGMPMEMVRHLQKIGATRAYTYQRRNADKRGIEWAITFREWWGIWEESGKWDSRGREKGGYVMGRHGDSGPYAIGNVSICTHSENALERERNCGSFEKACGKYKFRGRAELTAEAQSRND